MRKIIKLAICTLLIFAAFQVLDLWQDRQVLKENLIRLHVVANSDSDFDQNIKLKVKDAIVNYLQPIMEKFPDKETATQYIQDNLSALQALSNEVLDSLGIKSRATVTLQQETFDTREYDTFSLPSGVYDSLRIEIGAAEGKNWWCVVFPSLCLPASSSDFEDAAVSSGFSETLTGTLSNKSGYRVRFFLLDCIGRFENLFN